MRDSPSIIKNTGKPCFIRLFLPLSSPHPTWPYELQSSKPTAVTPEHLLGRCWFFLPSVYFPDSNKEVKKQWKNKNQGALLWTHTWNSYSLKRDVCLCVPEGTVRYFSYCETSLYCRPLIQSQIWMHNLELCKSKSFVLAYSTTRRLLEGFQNLEVFKASSCLFRYGRCGRRKGKPCFWMPQSFPFHMWLDAEMMRCAAETFFSFNSISRWDIVPLPKHREKQPNLFSSQKTFRFRSRLWQGLRVASHFIQLYSPSPNCDSTSGTATAKALPALSLRTLLFSGFCNFSWKKKKKERSNSRRAESCYEKFSAGEQFFCVYVATFQGNQIKPFWKSEKNL